MNTLYFYRSKNDLALSDDDFALSYSLDSGQVAGKHSANLNDGKRLNELADEIHDEYCSFVYSLNDQFLNKKLTFQNELSLYFISDLANKRTEFFDTFSDVCHLLLVKEKIENKRIDRIVIDGASSSFVKLVQSFFPVKVVTARNIKLSQRYSWFRRYIVPAFFFVEGVIKKWILVLFGFRNEKGRHIKNLYFATFPKNLKPDGHDIKYGKFVSDEDTFLISILTDGMHQYLSLITFLGQLKALKKIVYEKKAILLDLEIGFFDFFKAYFRGIALQWKRGSFFDRKFKFRNMDLSSYLQEELDLSFKRIPRLLLYEKAVRKVFTSNEVQNYFYYFHELCIGRFQSFVASTYFPKVTRTGFQHGGPIPRTKMFCALAKGEVGFAKDYLHHVPAPEKILCEDILSKKVYEEAGYRNVEVMPEVYRLEYLKAIRRDQVQSDTVLIACGLHDDIYLLENLLSEIQLQTHKKYLLKPHPKANKAVLERRVQEMSLDNLEIVEGPIAKSLAFVGEVICSDSSVSYEAFLLGIRVRIINLNNKITESVSLESIREAGLGRRDTVLEG